MYSTISSAFRRGSAGRSCCWGYLWRPASRRSEIVWPLLHRVNSHFAARTIESIDPKFKNSLISYLDLLKHREETPRAFLAAVEAKAVDDLTEVEIDAVVDQRRLIRMVYALAGVVVVFCLYSLLTPKSILDSTRRALLADVARPTNTRLVNIKPGNDPKQANVVAGTNVPFSVEIHGTRPRRSRCTTAWTAASSYGAQEFARGRSDYDPWTTMLREVQTRNGQKQVRYYIQGGDATSKTYRLNVRPTPMVLDVSHDLVFPAYIQRERRGDNLPPDDRGP